MTAPATILEGKNGFFSAFAGIEIDPAIIGTKALISAIAVQRPLTISSLSTVKELKTWQIDKFGKDIINILKEVG